MPISNHQLNFTDIQILQNAVETAIRKSQKDFLSKHTDEGYWVGELIGDSALESDYIMYMHFMERVDKEKQSKLVNYICSQQNQDGGWPLYYGGPSEVNNSVKAYFALRLADNDENEPHMIKARDTICSLGGMEALNTYSKIYMCMFGLCTWDEVPAIIPELIFFPKWFTFNFYEISAWTRTIVAPLSIIYSTKPRILTHIRLDQLFTGKKHLPRNNQKFLGNLLKKVDVGLRLYDSVAHHSNIRNQAIDQMKNWFIDRLLTPGGLGAIYPAMLNGIFALKCLGYSAESQEMLRAIEEFEKLEIIDEEKMRIQPCMSPVWDTAWMLVALLKSGIPSDNQNIQRGIQWLLQKECRFKGDWAMRHSDLEPGGWWFEFDNPFYPDVDDTVVVLMGLYLAGFEDDPAFKRGFNWMVAHQNSDGGWGAFDKDVTNVFLENIPWADHNAMLDPSCADITGRVLEFFGMIGYNEAKVIEPALNFLKNQQEDDGTWYGRWGTNYVYGTWQALCGLASIGEDMQQEYVIRSVKWLEKVQNEDGGWGETCASYDDSAQKGIGPSTPSQTAWGLIGLLSADVHPESPSLQAAIKYLLATQNENGDWDEKHHTGTGFPRVFYLIYSYYRNYFPLIALSLFRDKVKKYKG